MDDQLDPIHKVELAMLRVEHQKQFKTMIDFVKEKVGEGIEYSNNVARIVVSEQGAYYELLDLPEDFSGAAGDQVERRFVTPKEVTDLLALAVDATKKVNRSNTRHLSILILYTRRGIVDRKNCYVFDFKPDPDASIVLPTQVGKFQPGVMPLFFKVRMDTDFAHDVLDMGRGLVFGIANAGDRNLLIRIPFEGEPLVDLNNLPTTNTVH